MKPSLRTFSNALRTAALLLAAAGITACAVVPALAQRIRNLVQRPTLVEYDPPALSVDTSPLEQAGCTLSAPWWTCPEGGPKDEWGCEVLQSVSPLLGGLDPAPLAACIVRGHDALPEGEFLYSTGCAYPGYIRYVVAENGSLRLVHNLEELRALAAPIETPEEALSYALASQGLSALYDLSIDSSFRYQTRTLEETHVETTNEGYRVLLFNDYLCGCGPHTTFAVPVEVSRGGEVMRLEPQPIFQNPEYDGLCVD